MLSQLTQRNRWWKLPKEEVAPVVASVAQAILNDDQFRRDQFLRFGRLYGGMGMFGMANQANQIPWEYNLPVRYSLVREVVDNVLAQLTVSKPRALPLTDAGDWSLQRKAKLLGRFINGCMYAAKGDAKGVLMLRDALIFGTGVLKVSHDGQNMVVERVLPWELLVDEGDALYGDPQRMYQSRLVDRSTLYEIYGDVEAVTGAEKDTFGYATSLSTRQHSDLVTVYEAWSLPSSEGAKDGRHIICTSAGALLDERWDRKDFPFVIMSMTEPLTGIWGSGMAEEVAPLEMESNRLLEANKRNMQLFGVPQVWVEEGSKVNVTKLNNIPGQINTYTGRPPLVVNNQTVTKESTDAIDRYRASAFERFGANQMQGAGLKPAGLTSGVALRTWIDQGSTRLGPVQKRYEAAIVELGRKLVDAARHMYDTLGADYEANTPDTKFLRKIKWSEVNLDDSNYTLQVFPVNLLAKEPGARLEQVNEMLESGLVDQKVGRALLQFPDIDAWNDLENAPIDQINMIIEAMLDKGQYVGPTPFMDLTTGMRLVQLALVKAEVDGAPEEKLDLLRQWMEEADMLLNPPPPPAPPMAAPEMPPAPPPMGVDPTQAGAPPMDPAMMGADPGLGAEMGDAMPDLGGATNV